MIIRQCVGGVVFYSNKVLLVKNDQGEWVLPKGNLPKDELINEKATSNVKDETGVDATIIDLAGTTMYEFFSKTKQQDISKRVTWYIMESSNVDCEVNNEEILDCGFFRVKEAMDMLTHGKEKSLVDISFRKYKDLKRSSAGYVSLD